VRFLDPGGHVVAQVGLPFDFEPFRAFVGIVSAGRPIAAINVSRSRPAAVSRLPHAQGLRRIPPFGASDRLLLRVLPAHRVGQPGNRTRERSPGEKSLDAALLYALGRLAVRGST
jgi:hypothetical protein